MAYFLGKYVDGKYVPVKEDLCDTDILSVMDFTATFQNEEALRVFLMGQNLIKGDEPLAYIIRKRDGYNKINNGSYLSYRDSKKYCSSNGVYFELLEERFNIEFYTFLYRKLSDLYANVNYTVPQMMYFIPAFNEVNYAASIGQEAYESTSDKNDLVGLIKEFVKVSIGKYDSKTGTYEIGENGRIETNPRKVADLVLLFNEYYDIKRREELRSYEEELHRLEMEKQQEDEIDEKEEFLTEEDFENAGLNPDDYAHLIRK